MYLLRKRIDQIVIIALIITMTVCSCSRKEKPVIEDNSYPIVNAQLKSVEFDDKIMMPTNLILLEDSILVVYEPKMKDGFLSVFNTNTSRLISTFASIGESPEEFINPRILNALSTHDSFYVGDAKKIMRYNSSSFHTDDIKGSRILSVPQEMKYYNNILTLSDSLIVYTQTGEYPISLYDIPTEKLNFTGYFPSIEWTEGTPYIKNMEVFANCMTSDGKNVAIAYHNWNTISIVSPQGNVIKELFFPEWDFNKEKMKIEPTTGNLSLDPSCKVFFTQIRSNSKYIFALGWSDIKDNIKTGVASSYVYVIDWEGNVLKKITFDKSVSSFCVNDDTIPYVIAMGDDGELHVYECSIS